MRSDGWGDLVNPFTQLAGGASRVVADAWTVAMLGVWNAGLWLLRLVLGLLDDFLTPDLRETGPVASTYRVTFWVAITLVVVLTAVQAGVAAFRRDGRSSPGCSSGPASSSWCGPAGSPTSWCCWPPAPG